MTKYIFLINYNIHYVGFPIVNILQLYYIFVTHNESILIYYYSPMSIFYSESLSVYRLFFLSSTVLSRIPHCSYSLCLLRLLLAVIISQTFLDCGELESIEKYFQIFLTMLLNWDLPGFFLLSNWIGEEEHRRKVPLSSYLIKDTYC